MLFEVINFFRETTVTNLLTRKKRRFAWVKLTARNGFELILCPGRQPSLVMRVPKMKCTLFYVSNTFISNIKLKLAENQAEATQHQEAEFMLSESYSLCSSTLSFKNKRRYSKKNVHKQVCLF